MSRWPRRSTRPRIGRLAAMHSIAADRLRLVRPGDDPGTLTRRKTPSPTAFRRSGDPDLPEAESAVEETAWANDRVRAKPSAVGLAELSSSDQGPLCRRRKTLNVSCPTEVALALSVSWETHKCPGHRPQRSGRGFASPRPRDPATMERTPPPKPRRERNELRQTHQTIPDGERL